MPRKRKQEASSSDSDSGPEDRGPEKKKPAATVAPSKKADAKPATEEPSWPLDRLRFVKVREFKSRRSVDIREYYEKDGELLPGRKGIFLSAPQWEKLKSHISEIDKALADD